jgi:hypothetical protein
VKTLGSRSFRPPPSFDRGCLGGMSFPMRR